MTELQTRLLDMMKWFHSFCEDNDLTYYVLGGTMLGAVRHQGFIPWDDDLDVGLPRNDYERLLKLLKNDRGHYHLETPFSPDKHYCYPFSKLYDKETTLIENTKYKLVRGIYIDIFPLDGIGKTKLSSRFKYLPVDFLLNLLSINSLIPNSNRRRIKQIILTIYNVFFSKQINAKRIAILLDCYCRKHSRQKNNYGGNLLGAWKYREVMKLDILDEPQKYLFETMEVYGAGDYDSYLTSLYDNWRVLPPTEKRITHHDYYLDLNKPYGEY